MNRTETATVVLPIYGLQDGVDAVIRDLAVAAYALQTRGMTLNVLLLDDGRRDVAKKAAKHAAEFGLDTAIVSDVQTPGAAFIEGYKLALADETTDLVITLDATGQHDATQIPNLIDLLINRNLHAVIGSRWARHSGTPGLTVRRWAAAKLANAAFRQITRVRGLTDATTTFRVIRADALRQVHLDALPSDLYGIQMAIVAELVARGYRVGEGPIIYRAPAKPLHPVTASGAASFANHLVRLRRYANDVRRHRLSPAGRQFSHEHFDAAEDLEQLGTADRFFGWTLEEFEGHLDGTVLEVGAGIGTITRKLVEARPSLSVVALEPAANVYRDLASYAAVAKRVTAHQKTTEEYLRDGDACAFDAVLYLNVLEHIEDQDHELRLAHQALRPGGALLVFGPALEGLYSELDFNAGHYRRYSVAALRKAVEGAGFEIVSARYFDVLGVLPYYLVYRVLRRPAISGSTMWGYDRVLVPVSRFMQNVLRKPPLGKNVILVARKPA
jgi:SAM-dependent methyltransferase